MEKFGLNVENKNKVDEVLDNISSCFPAIENKINLDLKNNLDSIKLYTSLGTELDQTLKSDLEKVYEYNHPLIPPYDDFFTKVTQPEFNQALVDGRSRFIVAKDNKGSVVCFFRLTITDEQTISLGAVMANLLYPTKIAIKTVTGVSDYLNKNQITISANVDCNSPATTKYLNKAGFVAKEILIDVKDTKVNGFAIERQPTSVESQKDSTTKNYVSPENINYNNLPTKLELLFEENNDNKNTFLQTCEELFKRDYVLTKYLIAIPHDGKWCEAIDEIGVTYAKEKRRYCVFEKLNKN